LAMKFKVLVLDFDGVILESEGIKDWAFEKLFSQHPQHLKDILNYHKAHTAVGRFEKFQYITEQILSEKYTPSLEKSLGAEFARLVFERVVDCPFVKGAKEFLDGYFGEVPIYLASINPADELQKILQARQLEKYFKNVYTTPWLKKDVLKEIMGREGVSGDQALFIGDTFEDFRSAQDAGVSFIGRNSGKSFQGAPIRIFDDLTGVQEFLEQSGS